MIFGKVLPVALAIAVCVCLYALLWQHLEAPQLSVQDILPGMHSSHNAKVTYIDIDDVGEKWLPWRKDPGLKRGEVVNLSRRVNGESSSEPKSPKLQSQGHLNKMDPSIPSADTARDDGTPLLLNKKESFTKMPVWNFEDVYLEGPAPVPSTCPVSVRNTMKRLKRGFIPNIQLFLEKGHLSKSEWNRLAHFNNPFGFMGYNYTDIKQTVDLIPKERQAFLPKPKGRSCTRCAVVGSGGILNGSRMGKEIDSHDYVFRVNGAVIQGYEDDVGSKTSVYVHTAHSIITSLYIFKNYGFKKIPNDKDIRYVFIPEGLRDYEFLYGLFKKKPVSQGEYKNWRTWTLYPPDLDLSRFFIIHPDFLRYVRNRFLKSQTLESQYWHMYRPTNGAFTLFLALHTCDVVNAYGFITPDHGKYPNYYFERYSKTRVIFYVNHDYELEMKTWQQLHNEKVILLYQRDEKTQKPEGS